MRYRSVLAEVADTFRATVESKSTNSATLCPDWNVSDIEKHVKYRAGLSAIVRCEQFGLHFRSKRSGWIRCGSRKTGSSFGVAVSFLDASLFYLTFGEYFVHAEDINRGGEEWTPIKRSNDVEIACFEFLYFLLAARKISNVQLAGTLRSEIPQLMVTSIELETFVGMPSEALLFAYGRVAADKSARF